MFSVYGGATSGAMKMIRIMRGHAMPSHNPLINCRPFANVIICLMFSIILVTALFIFTRGISSA